MQAKKRPTLSLLSETARRKTSILISGHSNLPNAKKSNVKVRRRLKEGLRLRSRPLDRALFRPFPSRINR